MKNKRPDDASKKEKIEAHMKFKHAKKHKSKLKCFNYGNKGHFARKYTSSN